MNNIIDLLKKVDACLGLILRWVSMGALVIILGLLTLNVFIRFFPVFTITWFDEIIEMLFAWMIFVGAAALWRENEHFTLNFLPDALKGKKALYVLNIIINLISLTFLFIFMYFSFSLTMRASDWTPVLRLPKKLLYASMPFGGTVMVLYTLRNILESLVSLFSKRSLASNISKECKA